MDFRAFEATPGVSVIVLPDAPRYTHVAVSNDCIRTSGMKRADLIGKGHFEVFSANPDDPASTGEQQVRASFEDIIRRKVPNEIPFVRYDIPNGDGSFHHKYWKVNNAPILDEEGAVQYIIHSAIDITDQVLDKEQIESTRGLQKAYNFFMNAPVIIGYVKGDDYVIELANEGLLEVWGRTAEVIGKPLEAAIPELKDQGFTTLLDRVRSTGEPFFAYEYPIALNRGGKEEVLYFDFVYQPYYENVTETIASGVVSVGHEVTAQVMAKKKVEEAEQASERQKRLYEAINGSTPDLIYVFDLDYRFTYANKALLEMWGKTAEDAIGKSLLENGYEPWHAEMHEREIDQVVATKKPIRGEVSFPHATLGRRVYDYIFVPVINEEGAVEAVAGTTRDITELKQAEQSIRESDERFRHLADDSPIFVFIIDADPAAPVNYWNKTWLQYTGRSREEAIGRAWEGILHPDDVPMVRQLYTPAFEQKEAYFIPAVRVRRHDGVYRWHAFKGNPRYGANGEFNGYVGVGFDIHEQKEAQDALKESELQLQQKVAERTAELERTVEELRRSNTNLEEFAYAASHDLKEPVRKIHFFGERIKDSLSDRMTPEESRYFERMESAAKRMGSLIDDLLSYSQISIRPRTFEDVNMNGLIDLVLEDLDLEIDDKGATVTVDNLFTIRGHHRQLQQAFQNLISNALKYSQPGVPPRIRISCAKVPGSAAGLRLSAEEGQKRFYCVAISDNGIGFEQSDAERIFNVFTRLHGNTEYRGTGIGLSIVRKVVENHNGHIWAEAKPGEGATFKILLPAD